MGGSKFYRLTINNFRLLSIRCISRAADEISMKKMSGFIKSSLLEAAFQLKTNFTDLHK